MELEQEWEALRPRLASLAAPPVGSRPEPEDRWPCRGIAGEGALGAVGGARQLGRSRHRRTGRSRSFRARGGRNDARAGDGASDARVDATLSGYLEKRLSLETGLALTADAMATADAGLRRLAADPAIPPEARTTWIARLDGADARIASGSTLEDFAEAVRAVAETNTQSMRDQESAMLGRLKQVEDAAGEELALSAVNAEFIRWDARPADPGRPRGRNRQGVRGVAGLAGSRPR